MSNYFLDRFQGAWLGGMVPLLVSQPKGSKVLSPSVTGWEQDVYKQIKQQYDLLLGLQNNQPVVAQAETFNSIAELLLKLLPAVVYFHDDWSQLRRILSGQSSNLALSSEAEADILVWSYIVGLALRRENNFADLANLAVTRLGLNTGDIEWLEILETAFLQGFTFTELESHMKSRQNKEVPLSLFCFLGNHRNFFLAVSQALAIVDSKEVASLTGALAGAHVGWRGIPPVWRNRLRKCSFFSDIKRYTEELYRMWSGVEYFSSCHDCECVGLANPLSFAIAAPRVVQERAELKIISQAEYRRE